MATKTMTLDPALEARVAELVTIKFNELLQGQFAELVSRQVQDRLDGSKGTRKRLAIVASKGTLDMAYPPLILATSAAAMGWEVGVFFTFYGLDIINRRKLGRLKVAPLGNPAMPEPLPKLPVPNLIGAIPGMTAIATMMMKSWMDRAKVPSVRDLLEVAQESEVRLFACTTTMGVMQTKPEDIIDGAEFAGAASFLDFASEAHVSLFV